MARVGLLVQGALAATLVAAVLASPAPTRADTGAPPFTCDPVAAAVPSFVADLGRVELGLNVTKLKQDRLWDAVADAFALGMIDCRLGALLDSISTGTIDTTHPFPSLAGLDLASRRMVVAFTMVELEGDFTPNCDRVRELVFGGPKAITDVAVALNAAKGSPITTAQVLAQPFCQTSLVWELARATDRLGGFVGGWHYAHHGQVVAQHCQGHDWDDQDPFDSSDCSCHHPHGGLVTQPSTVVADPLKQLIIADRAGDRATYRLNHHDQKLWQIASQADLDALMTGLGDHTPPAALSRGPLPTYTNSASFYPGCWSMCSGFIPCAPGFNTSAFACNVVPN